MSSSVDWKMVGTCVLAGAVAALPFPGSYHVADAIANKIIGRDKSSSNCFWYTLNICAITGKAATIALLSVLFVLGVITGPVVVNVVSVIASIIMLCLALRSMVFFTPILMRCFL